MKEVWKDIPNFEGYQVSNLGRVRNNITKKFLTGGIKRGGYRQIILRKDNKSNYKLVHRLVAEVFIPNTKNKPQVNHIDGNKLNNKANNLEWCTQSENMIHAYQTGLEKIKKGENNPLAKKVYQYDINNKYIKKYGSIHEASRMTNIRATDISHCCHNERKTAGGYKWRFEKNGFV